MTKDTKQTRTKVIYQKAESLTPHLCLQVTAYDWWFGKCSGWRILPPNLPFTLGCALDPTSVHTKWHL